MDHMSALQILELVSGWSIAVLLDLFGLAVVVNMFMGRIPLAGLITEQVVVPNNPVADGASATMLTFPAAAPSSPLVIPTAPASIARFQFLVFTFVIAFSLYLVVVHNLSLNLVTALNPTPEYFPKIDGSILALLGISAGSQSISKAIQANQNTTIAAQNASSAPAPD